MIRGFPPEVKAWLTAIMFYMWHTSLSPEEPKEELCLHGPHKATNHRRNNILNPLPWFRWQFSLTLLLCLKQQVVMKHTQTVNSPSSRTEQRIKQKSRKSSSDNSRWRKLHWSVFAVLKKEVENKKIWNSWGLASLQERDSFWWMKDIDTFISCIIYSKLLFSVCNFDAVTFERGRNFKKETSNCSKFQF